ncbi:MAG: Stf0 sulfotransferase [Pararhodobacter sp.]|nr:Stf0 sulfotransferase [Pararhodobacter sp.]
MDSYILCATPRTGSTLLCDLLSATGVAGAPDSIFMGNPDPFWQRAWGLPETGSLQDPAHCAAYLRAGVRAGTAGTGRFGLRLMYRDLDALQAMIDRVHPGLPTDRARFEAAFGRVLYVHLTRDDRLAQAVSMVKAEQTGLWHIGTDGREIERLAPPQAPVYDRARIAAKLAELTAADAIWQRWFTAEGIDPLRLSYEALAADPAAAVSCICHAQEVEAPEPAPPQPGVARLSDAVNRDWMARFRAEGG